MFTLFGIGFLISLLEPSIEAKKIIYTALFLLYDPLCVSILGNTLGHKMLGIVVKKKAQPSENISFFNALIRFFLKAVLGWISLITVSSDSMKRALHDIAAGSIVMFRAKKTE